MFFVSQKGVPVLMYHYLGEAPRAEDRPYFVTPSAFAEQMQFLRERGFRSITLDQMIEAMRGMARLPKRPIVLTFDDGHASFEQIGAPILRSKGFTATMFVITSKLGQPGFLGEETVRSLAREGFQFGSHSHTHPILTQLADADVMFELSESKERLEKVLGREVKYFCYRGGHFNEKVKKLVRDAGYSGAVCSKAGVNTPASDILELCRIGIRGTDDIRQFARKIRGDGLNRPRSLSSFFLLSK